MGERLAVTGDIAIVLVLGVLLVTGSVNSSSIFTAVTYVLVAAFLSLSVWGFRARLGFGRSPSSQPTSAGVGKKVTSLLTVSPETREKVIANETTVIKAGEYSPYSVGATQGDRITGTIASDEPISLYIMKDTAFRSWDNGGNPNMEEIKEGLLRYSLDFAPSYSAEWYVVLENESPGDAEVEVFIRISYG